MTQRIGEAPVTCEPRETSGDVTRTALCRVEGDDLGAWLVGQGYAMAKRQDPNPYCEIAARAWAKRLGMWSGVFQDPDAWRQANQSKPSARLAAGLSVE